jgi:hypothetical protein
MPACQASNFIHDPLDYGTITHHSAADTYSHIVPEDLMQAAAVIASLVADFANQEQMFPRKASKYPPQSSRFQKTVVSHHRPSG